MVKLALYRLAGKVVFGQFTPLIFSQATLITLSVRGSLSSLAVSASGLPMVGAIGLDKGLVRLTKVNSEES